MGTGGHRWQVLGDLQICPIMCLKSKTLFARKVLMNLMIAMVYEGVNGVSDKREGDQCGWCQCFGS